MRTWVIGGAMMAAVAGTFPAVASAQLVVSSETVQEETALPGERYDGRVRVLNSGSDPIEVEIYQTDYLFQSDGKTEYPEAGTLARSNASWIRVSPATAVIPAGEEVGFAYTVSVPTGELAGTYWSMLMVEPLADAASLARSEDGLSVRTVVRFGVQVATHIREGAEHRLDIVGARVHADEEGRRLSFSLVNEGTAAYRPVVAVELYDTAGAMVAAESVERGLVYPGTSALQEFDLSALPDGTYRALVVVDTGAPDVFGAQFDLTLGPVR